MTRGAYRAIVCRLPKTGDLGLRAVWMNTNRQDAILTTTAANGTRGFSSAGGACRGARRREFSAALAPVVRSAE
jgi:hypothetical protein